MERSKRSLLISVSLLLLPTLLPAQEEWIRLELAKHESGVLFGATSELEDPGPGERGPYGPRLLFDFDPSTGWSEGAPGDGVGEAIYISVEPGTTALGLRNGFARSDTLFEANNRPRFLTVTPIGALNLEGFATEYVTVYDGRQLAPSARIALEDRPTPQRVELPYDWNRLEEAMESLLASEAVQEMRFPQAREMGAGPQAPIPLNTRYLLKLEIAGIYEGNRWPDTCISDLWSDYGPVEAVEVTEDGAGLLVYTEAGYAVEVYREEESVLQMAAVSPEAEWAVLVASPREAGSGRVSTEYRLINSATGKELTDELIEKPAPMLLGFEPGEGAPRVLVGDAGKTAEVRCELYPFNEAPR